MIHPPLASLVPAVLTTAVLAGLAATASAGEGFYAASGPAPSQLVRFEWPTGSAVSIATIPNIDVTDLALSPQGVLYASTVDELYTVDVLSGFSALLTPVVTSANITGIEFDDNGTLWACTYFGELMTIDLQSGNTTSLFLLPLHYSGDLAFRDANTIYALYDGFTGTQLVKLDLGPAGNHFFLGEIAPGVTFKGLDFDGSGNLIAVATNGDVYEIAHYANSATGTLISSTGQPGLVGMTSGDGVCPTPQAFCTAGTTSGGCVATISSAGTPKPSAASGFTITVSGAEPQKQGLIFYGIDNSGFTPLPWGLSTSYLCVKPPTQRSAPQFTGGTLGACDGTLAIDWNTFVSTHPGALGTPFSAGDYVFAQGWFRDPPSAKTTSLSNALRFLVCP